MDSIFWKAKWSLFPFPERRRQWKKLLQNIVSFFSQSVDIHRTVKWWNLSGPPCFRKVDSLMRGGVSSQVALYQLAPVMEPGKYVLHTFLPLKLSWESIMFAAGSPPFGTMGACYYYKLRHGQPVSVPKIWKCRHRRSVVPEEGKLASQSPSFCWVSKGWAMEAEFMVKGHILAHDKFVQVSSHCKLQVWCSQILKIVPSEY